MEFSQLVGGAEECSSSESGWTMYLASPMHGQTLIEEEEEEEEVLTSEEDGGGGEDGDSLASDASSGPPNRTPVDQNYEEEDLRVNQYACRRSLKGKEKKIEDCEKSVPLMGDEK